MINLVALHGKAYSWRKCNNSLTKNIIGKSTRKRYMRGGGQEEMNNCNKSTFSLTHIQSEKYETWSSTRRMSTGKVKKEKK